MLQPSGVWDPWTSSWTTHSSSPTTHPFPALLTPTSPKSASNFSCLINPSLLPKGSLSTPLANPGKLAAEEAPSVVEVSSYLE